MNKAMLTGRLTRDPEIRTTAGENGMEIARFTLAVDRRIKRENEPSADFIQCIAFGKSAEFAEKWLKQGVKVEVSGHIQTGSYTDREGRRVYTTDVIVEELGFAESKSSSNSSGQTFSENFKKMEQNPENTDADGFMNIPDEVEELPFH